MITKISFAIVLLITFTVNLFSQQKVFNDYTIISSGNSYIEIEYTPEYNGNSFSNSLNGVSKPGYPDVGYRSFPVYTPGKDNNKIEIINIETETLNNADIPPVPFMEREKQKRDVIYNNKRDDEIYNTNEYYPKSNNALIQTGIQRDKYTALAQIFPIQFNPVQKTIIRIKKIRFRISFASQPVYSNRQYSVAEKDFFSGMALNWQNAINWSNKETLNNKSSFQNSFFSSGSIFRIEVKETGIYKITKNQLQDAGINVSQIDPRTLKIYGNGGKEVNYANNDYYPFDPVENSIYVEGENDGQFNENDFILFYGESPDLWIKKDTIYTHRINPYSNTNYYWLSFGGNNGKRMNIISSPNTPNLTPEQYFIDKLFDEPDVNNLGSTGKIWLSNRIGTNESFNFNKILKGLINSIAVRFKLHIGNGTRGFGNEIRYLIKDNNSSLSMVTDQIGSIYDEFQHFYPAPLLDIYYNINSGNTMNLQVSLPAQYNPSFASGYFNYLEVFYARSFSSAENNYFKFTSPFKTGTLEYQISSFTGSDAKIFRINNYDDATIINALSYSNGVIRFQDNQSFDESRDYYVISDNNYKSISGGLKSVPNQNLKGSTNGYDYIIISPPEFMAQANELKQLRESYGEGNPNYLKTLVVDVDQIFNEFASGKRDPVAIRNYLKYAYTNWERKPVYVLFFGDGGFDYKNILGLSVKNWLPPIEKDDPYINEIESYNSDDFFVDFDESYPSPRECKPDMSPGRFCVNNVNDAQSSVNKIKLYESPATFGNWKKINMYCADDGWTTTHQQGQEGNMHQQPTEELAEYYTPQDYEKQKVYIVAYPSESTPQGRRKPLANADIIRGWNEGRLIINWTGHGSTDLWAHEHVFVRDESLPLLKNKGKYPFVTIASCDLARWDDPFLISAGEQLVYFQDAGAIGVIAATRPVYASANNTFNAMLWSYLSFSKDTLNLSIRLGKALSKVKNNLISDFPGSNDMKYVLIGDPGMRLGATQHITKIDSINDAGRMDTALVKSLQGMKISGTILKPDSTIWSDYNGDLDIKVFDVDKNISITDFGYNFYWKEAGGIIFKGKTKITNGKWSTEFIVPKDISYSTGNGKILLYFNNGFSEGSGFSRNFVLNGIDNNAPVDTIGPQISLYMDSRNFRSGDIINQKSKIIADIFDNSGVNLTGALGHKLEAIVNNDENNKIDLTNYYTASNGYQNGTIDYPFENLADGSYTMKLKVWDTYNNLSTAEIFFTVKSTSQLAVSTVYNYPNPMRDFTTFAFQHNFDSPVNSEIKIYTVAGRLIKTLQRTNITDKNVLIEWDGKDEDGDYIANGTYIYKLIVKSDNKDFNNIQTGKIAKLK